MLGYSTNSPVPSTQNNVLHLQVQETAPILEISMFTLHLTRHNPSSIHTREYRLSPDTV